MHSFSQRIGKTPIRTALQLEGIDNDLRVGIWNGIYNFIDSPLHNHAFSITTWSDFFKKPIDHYGHSSFFNLIKNFVLDDEWYFVYDLVEYMAKSMLFSGKERFITKINQVLEREVSGYRIICNQITPIVSEIEIQTIEDASKSGFLPVEKHLHAAIEMMSRRQVPDYRNSIKEAISAVESMCKILTKDESITLGKALPILAKKSEINTTLKSAFMTLYGYTSDEGGIRHALTEEDCKVGMEEAKFMLVACSAFVNYLKSKQNK